MSQKRDRLRPRRAGTQPLLVVGEPLDVLVDDLLSFEWEHEDDGMVHVHAEGLSPAFMRAHMRIEAELLLADADDWATAGYEDRTHEQRAADALVELTRRVGEAATSTRIT
jgi:hypothetical protein